MATQPTADDVLKVAEKMERDAARFYRRAAGTCDDPKLCKLYVELARWERQHVLVFADMREHLSERSADSGRFTLDEADQSSTELPLPLVFDGHDSRMADRSDGQTKADVLRIAIRKEEDTISYYAGLKKFGLGHNDTQVIKAMIREEEQHVRILTQSLEHMH